MMAYIKFLAIVLLLLLLFLFLIAPRILKKPDMSKLYKYHYAHRGLFNNNSLAPENSIKAFKLAIDEGYGIELDVQLTKDNIPVVFHDASLKRMCNIKRNICDMNLEELKRIKLAHSSESIPTLKEALAAIGGLTPVIIELKPYNIPSKLCSRTWSALATYKGPYCIESFHPFVLHWFKKHQPHITRGQLCMNYWKESEYRGQVIYLILSSLLTNFLTRPDFISYKHNHANNIFFRICKYLGATAFAWTIRSQNDYETARKHFDLFIFDSFRL